MITAFILLCLVELIVVALCVHKEQGTAGFFALLIGLGIYAWFTHNIVMFADLWHFIIAHPILIVGYFAAYIVIGVLWSFFKYYSYVREKKRQNYTYEELKKMNNTTRVMRWMGYWPFSIVAHVFGDGLYKLFRWVYDKVSTVYDRILIGVYGPEAVKK